MAVLRALSLCAALALASADVTVEGVTFTDGEAAEALAVANTASFETLHYTFDVFDWKAHNIVKGRWYGDLAALGGVDGVTPFVLALLRNKVREGCVWKAEGGAYGGVHFTDSEAAAVLNAANRASFASLVHVADVYGWKVENMFRARGICSMGDLAEVTGVTPYVLNLLKSYAHEDACYARAECATGETCVGVPFDSIAAGRCVDQAPVLGEGASCTETQPCAPDLVCSGLASGWTEGACRPAWMGNTFAPPVHVAVVAVPAPGKTATTFFAVGGLSSVPEDVVLRMDASGVVNPGALRIVLTDPSGGNVAVYYDGAAAGGAPIPALAALGNSRDDEVNGRWTLTVTAQKGGAPPSGMIAGLALELTSRWD